MKKLLTLLLLGAALAAPSVAQTAEDLFQQALREERVAGNTEAAIRLYRQIVADRSADRAVVARSLLQMGKAYEALGRDGASAAYARIVNEFGDFAAIAAEASSRMAGLRREAQVEAEPVPGSIGTVVLGQGKPGGGIVTSISPDGGFILVSTPVSAMRPRRTIVLHEVRTGIVDSLQAANEACRYAVVFAYFSPDGGRIAMDCGDEDGNDAVTVVYDRRTASAREVFAASAYLPSDANDYYTRVWGWSEDGQGHIVDVFNWKPGSLGLHHRLLVPVSGRPPRVLEDDLAGSYFDEDPICALRNDRFLFGEYGSDRTPQRRTAIHRSDVVLGTRIPVLTDGRDSFELYACLPTENTLVFSRTLLDETESLFAVTVDESGEFGSPRFLATLGKNAYPVWGARNGNIYFRYSGSQMFNALVEVDAFAGTGYTNLRRFQGDGDGIPGMHAWSSDGLRLARISANEILLMDSDGQLETRIARPEVGPYFVSLVWSPSGDRIIHSNSLQPGFVGTRVFDRRTGHLQNEVPDITAVAWLAEERGFLYVSDDRRCLRSHLFESGATEEVFCTDAITLPRGAAYWAQSADGRVLAVQAFKDSSAVLHTLTLSDGRLSEVDVTEARMGQQIRRLRWSVDDRYLYFYSLKGQGGTTYDLQTGTSTEWSTGSLSRIATLFELGPDGKRAVITGVTPPPEGSGAEISVLHRPAGLLPPK